MEALICILNSTYSKDLDIVNKIVDADFLKILIPKLNKSNEIFIINALDIMLNILHARNLKYPIEDDGFHIFNHPDVWNIFESLQFHHSHIVYTKVCQFIDIAHVFLSH